jgi:hypothetical protein
VRDVDLDAVRHQPDRTGDFLALMLQRPQIRRAILHKEILVNARLQKRRVAELRPIS